MEPGTTACKPRDILSNPSLTFALFWLPLIAIIVSGGSGLSSCWRTIVWVTALVIMWTACVVNALRCGRVHCYITGPFFFVMALVTLLCGLGVVSLGRRGWIVIELTILVGAVCLNLPPRDLSWEIPEGRTGEYRPSLSSIF